MKLLTHHDIMRTAKLVRCWLLFRRIPNLFYYFSASTGFSLISYLSESSDYSLSNTFFGILSSYSYNTLSILTSLQLYLAIVSIA